VKQCYWFLKNTPKPLAESWYLKSSRVHKRYLFMPNMSIMDTHFTAKATEIGWRSTPNLKFRQITSDIRRLESLEQRDSKSLLDGRGRLCVSTPNIPVRQNIAGDTPAAKIGWRSMPNLKLMQVTSDVRRPESLEHPDLSSKFRL